MAAPPAIVGFADEQDQVGVVQSHVGENFVGGIGDVDDEAMLVFLDREPVDHRGRQAFVARRGQRGRAGLAQRRGGQAGRPERLQHGAQLRRHCRHRVHRAERQQRNGLQRPTDVRNARGAIAQATGDAPGDVPGEFRPLSCEPVERRRGHLQQQAVADGADAGGARAAGQHADLADGFARIDLGHESLAGFGAIGLFEPDLHATAGEQVEAVRGIALTKEPVATVADAGLEFIEDDGSFSRGNGKILLQRRDQRRPSG